MEMPVLEALYICRVVCKIGGNNINKLGNLRKANWKLDKLTVCKIWSNIVENPIVDLEEITELRAGVVSEVYIEFSSCRCISEDLRWFLKMKKKKC